MKFGKLKKCDYNRSVTINGVTISGVGCICLAYSFRPMGTPLLSKHGGTLCLEGTLILQIIVPQPPPPPLPIFFYFCQCTPIISCTPKKLLFFHHHFFINFWYFQTRVTGKELLSPSLLAICWLTKYTSYEL